MRKNKLLLLLALLLTAATGAWAQETPLLTIESTGYTDFKSGSKTFDDKVTVTFSNPVYYDGEEGWYADGTASLLTVAGINGYTITSCKFYTNGGDAQTGYTVEGESPSVYLSASTEVYTDANQSVYLGYQGVKKIEVFGAAAATGYTVSLKDGVKDAGKWTVKVGDGQAQALPIGGLKGDGKETVTLQYNGRLKVKGVKATSEAAEASVPDGALSGKFSVSDGKQVYFSKGNLRYASSKWSFFDNQYDYYTSYSEEENAWDKFGWSTSAPTYGMNTTTSVNDYQGDFVDWGATMGAGWFTLSSDEWTYLLNNRSASTVGGTENGRYAKAKVNDVKGVILFPDTYTHPDGVTAPTGVNATAAAGWNANSYTAADWTKMESAGCVFLPAAGRRNGSSMEYAGERGVYWSATPNGTYYAYGVLSTSDILNPAYPNSRRLGSSVRLVREAAATDAEQAKEPATVTTAPTGAAIVGVGKNTALVSGGVADGGTLMYAVTTTNTKPASTDGFSATVPTAETITASGKVYVWYYVKGDDTHSDSEIAGPVSVTVTPALSLTNPVVGQVIGSDGKNYAAASVPSGVTKVAMIAYVSGSNGLAIALADEGLLNWATAKSTCEAKTPAFTGGTWKLPSMGEWNQMFSANGGDEESYTGLNTKINTAGGTALQSGFYWSSSEYSPGVGAHLVHLDDGDADWSKANETLVRKVRACLAFTVEQAAKPAATVTTAPTGAAIVGVGKTTELVSGGVADGGTLWYAVTTTNTKPTSTDGFSDAVPTAQTITASGKVYVWYYVKGDDTHSDSEIAATAIEVPVADVVWDATNVSNIEVSGTDISYDKEGVKLSANDFGIQALWYDSGDPTHDGIIFSAYQSGGFTFTAPTGKAFTKIEMTVTEPGGWLDANLGTGWVSNPPTVTWKGSAAASTVDLLTGADMFHGEPVKSIVFYLSE